jgi:tungstate transport system substrate-binding protein
LIRIVSLFLSLVVVSNAYADELSMTLRTTKSTQLSGLLDYILPIFKTASNLSVHVVAVDAGQAVAIDRRDDANALLLDDRPAEDKIIADGYGVVRLDAMYDDFVIVGPSSDPAGIRGFNDAGKAFAQIAATGALFASRGDDSGTNRLELRLWKSAGAEPDKQAAWYRDVAQGMEETLNLAAAMNAYTLTDRATWANFKNRRSLEILTEGYPALFDTFGTILISPDYSTPEKFVYARIWHEWLTNHHGREAFTSYKVNGEQIFFPPHLEAAH